jgi:hypothetical protein
MDDFCSFCDRKNFFKDIIFVYLNKIVCKWLQIEEWSTLKHFSYHVPFGVGCQFSNNQIWRTWSWNVQVKCNSFIQLKSIVTTQTVKNNVILNSLFDTFVKRGLFDRQEDLTQQGEANVIADYSCFCHSGCSLKPSTYFISKACTKCVKYYSQRALIHRSLDFPIMYNNNKYLSHTAFRI